jgi:hypothetical protein
MGSNPDTVYWMDVSDDARKLHITLKKIETKGGQKNIEK